MLKHSTADQVLKQPAFRLLCTYRFFDGAVNTLHLCCKRVPIYLNSVYFVLEALDLEPIILN